MLIKGEEFMKKVLVVYYSRGGKTEKAAIELAKGLNADVEKLVDYKNRNGILGYIFSGRDAATKRLTIIEPVKYNPLNYDLVVLATPTWASTMAPAIRTFIHQRKGDVRQVAFLVTQAGGCTGKIYKDMEESLGLSSVAALDLGGKHFKENKWQQRIEDLTARLL
jgi:flavodoxin